MAALQRARQLWSVLVRAKGFDRVANKVDVVSFEEGKCLFKMTVGEEDQNRVGTLHGGLTATLIDTLTTFVLATQPPFVPGVSVDMSISYLRPAKVGEEITINAEVVKMGKKLAFTAADLVNQDGKCIARGSHTKYIGQDSPSVKSNS